MRSARDQRRWRIGSVPGRRAPPARSGATLGPRTSPADGPPSAEAVPGTPARVLSAGAHGHGRTHLNNLVRSGPVTVAGVFYPRAVLLENLIAHVARPGAVEILVPLRATGAFTAVVRAAPDPAEIGEPHRVRTADEYGDRLVVAGINDLAAACSAALYSELGAP